MDYRALDQQYIANTYARYNVLLTHGKGSCLYDDGGRQYIDFASGIAVNTFGIADDAWIAAVTAQLGQLQHVSNLYYTKPQVELAQMLCARTGMRKVFFSNSGAEANECAAKAARKYYSDRHDQADSVIITLQQSFHGRTITTLSATGQGAMHQHFQPFTPGFVHVPANDIAAFSAALETYPCSAFLFEVIQGEGGLNQLDAAFLQEAAKLAEDHDVLLIADEVQTGNGRSGKLYSYMHYGIQPDIVSTAKGLAGGLPFGTTLLGEKVADTLDIGSHGSTFGGNPVCAAGACNILSRLDTDFLAGVTQKGEWIAQYLQGKPGVDAVYGMGLMRGVAIQKSAPDVVQRCLQRGLLVLTAKDKIRLLPALNIPQETLEAGLEILCAVLAE